MISTLSITGMIFTLCISFLFPIGLWFFFRRRYQVSIKALIVGAAVFTAFQLLSRIPLLEYLTKYQWYLDLQSNIIYYSLFLSITAGLFEEFGRYIGFSVFLRDVLSWKNGISYGIGHGGIEAIFLVGISYINNLVLSFLINSGQYNQIIGEQIGSAAAELLKNQLLNVSSNVFFMAGVERLLVIIIHIALSLVVLYAVMKNRPIYLLHAIIIHTLVNLPAAYISLSGMNLIISEVILALYALLALIWINKARISLDHIF